MLNSKEIEDYVFLKEELNSEELNDLLKKYKNFKISIHSDNDIENSSFNLKLTYKRYENLQEVTNRVRHYLQDRLNMRIKSKI